MKSSKSKLLYPLLGFTVAERSWNQAAFLATHICMVVGHQRESVQKNVEIYLDKTGAGKERKTTFVVQDPPLGTGDAIKKALAVLETEDGASTHLFIMGGDAVMLRPFTLASFLEGHLQKQSQFSLMTATVEPAGAYGRVIRDKKGEVERIVEAKNATSEELKINEINAGFYLIRLDLLREALSKLTKNAQTGEFYLTDVVSFARAKSLEVDGYLLADATESMGFNTQEEFVLARRVLQGRINSHWLREGVVMDDPATTWIDETVVLSPDVHLGMNVQLLNGTRVQAGAKIRSNSIVDNSVIGADTSVEAFSHIVDSDIGPACTLGPYARLRPGCVLDEKVKIGNFVEAKKSHFAKGSKANHLSYVGDAEVGEDANIGAGTITCNYDGFDKHQTKIGRGVFIGSNSSLVAPVSLGAGSVVGAGSVISKDVPADSLAVERSEQRIITDGAKKFRSKRSKGV